MVVVQLDKARNLLLGFEGLRKFKQITGKSLSKLDQESDDFEDYIPAIFYSGLVHEDKDLTEEKVIHLLDQHIGIKGALELIPKIFEDVFGKQDDVKND